MRHLKVNTKNKEKIEQVIEKVQSRCTVRLAKFSDLKTAIDKVYEIAPCKKSMQGVVISVCSGAFKKPSRYKYPAMGTVCFLRLDGKGGATLIDIKRCNVPDNVINIISIPDSKKFGDYLCDDFLYTVARVCELDTSPDDCVAPFPKVAKIHDVNKIGKNGDYHTITIDAGETGYSGKCFAVSYTYPDDFFGLCLNLGACTPVRVHVVPEWFPVPEHYKYVSTVTGSNLFIYTPDCDLQTAEIYTGDWPLYNFDFYRAGFTGILCKVSKVKEG